MTLTLQQKKSIVYLTIMHLPGGSTYDIILRNQQHLQQLVDGWGSSARRYAGIINVKLVVHQHLGAHRSVEVGQLVSNTCEFCNDVHFSPYGLDGSYVDDQGDISSFPDWAFCALIDAAGYTADQRGNWVKKKEDKTKR